MTSAPQAEGPSISSVLETRTASHPSLHPRDLSCLPVPLSPYSLLCPCMDPSLVLCDVTLPSRLSRVVWADSVPTPLPPSTTQCLTQTE